MTDQFTPLGFAPIDPETGEPFLAATKAGQDALQASVGEPIESPVQYTLLDRAKSLVTVAASGLQTLANIFTRLGDGNQQTQVTNFPALQAVADDYVPGELLADQIGAGDVLVFTFASQVASFWVAVVGDEGVVKIDHYGGTPSPSLGIPIQAGGMVPIPEPATIVKIYAPSGLVVTVWGQRRA